MNEQQVFDFYATQVKPIYSEIEAIQNEMPVELLHEIHAAFDHLKRIYYNDENEEVCCINALSHLQRGVLDAYKIKLKNFNDTYVKYSSIDNDILRLVDNGAYLPNMIKAKKEISDTAKQARIAESSMNKDDATKYWTNTANMIDAFEDNFLSKDKISQLEWGKSEVNRMNTIISRINKGTLFVSVLGIITTIILSIFQIVRF